MKVIVLQHIKIEDPGYIKDLMIEDKCELTTVELDEGDKIPENLDKFDAMLCMGGPMDTWMEDSYKWLRDEKNKIKEFVVDLEKPFIGFCLGCQLLGEVVGGNVVKSNPVEIGMLDVNLSSTKLDDKLFRTFPDKIKALQWHSYEVQGLENNDDITVIGSSPTTKYQIFKYKQHAYGIQFHIEIKDNTVSDWGCVPEYKQALEKTLGDGALEKFHESAMKNIYELNGYSKIIYNNFKKIVFQNA
ncbi:MAG: hypothetical protein CFH21_00200 [Alphaproteobacteria bacterium MarineAlpha5_Bin11]|nr:MAG: hypothetical protein CFH21_00200 [Alphaproteobacteria bacterium MarineAlpha5_Bin11]PPR50219.1 MAG: hypothetical protein CFH20_00959 [Alphaproteobacteria bacterium MarineAlpha5_Bin10]|tara:strand:- start:3245 stop:3976 length:732 start_codon:yes stop_codon:yes gene_type:complete